MKRIAVVLLLSTLAITGVQAQKYITKNGHIRFFSSTPVEDIEAHNRQVNSALDQQSGEFVFRVLIKSFQFEKALMQEHFNENYMESDKFPNATFSGTVTNIKDVDFAKNGSYPVTVEGDLTIRGITKKISESGVLEVKDGKVSGKSTFNVLLADYGIKVPAAVANNIARSIQIDVDVLLSKLEK
ncbi:MAG TPA: YceI family protein [Lentimicrobium sp.]|jgi:polyisoprenoid-binding protein YceI|nr:YceI family protein [Lentimicrobium sp.]